MIDGGAETDAVGEGRGEKGVLSPETGKVDDADAGGRDKVTVWLDSGEVGAVRAGIAGAQVCKPFFDEAFYLVLATEADASRDCVKRDLCLWDKRPWGALRVRRERRKPVDSYSLNGLARHEDPQQMAQVDWGIGQGGGRA